MTSIFHRAIGPDFGRLHPELQRRFSVGLGSGEACVGTGTMERICWTESSPIRRWPAWSTCPVLPELLRPPSSVSSCTRGLIVRAVPARSRRSISWAPSPRCSRTGIRWSAAPSAPRCVAGHVRDVERGGELDHDRGRRGLVDPSGRAWPGQLSGDRFAGGDPQAQLRAWRDR